MVGEARLARPRSGAPPPTIAGADAEWCGARNGGTRISPPPGASRPATEWIRVTSSAASSSSSGRIPGSRRASIVLPVPGGPASSTLCVPAAAISSARRARSWPRTSARSGTGSRSTSRSGNGSGGSCVPRRYATASARWWTGIGSTPASATSGAGLGRADEPAEARAPRSLGGDQRAGDGPDAPVERELAERGDIRRAHRRQLMRRGEHRERDREVEPRALLAQARGREVDRDPPHRETRARPRRCPLRTRSFASWQARSASPTIANDGRASCEVGLDLDPARLEADERMRDRSSEHDATLGG